jgi:hypothetical protein
VSALATGLDLDLPLSPTDAGGPDIFPLPQFFDVGPVRVGIGSIRITGGHAVIRAPESSVTVEVAGADVTARPRAGGLDVSGRLETLRVDALGRREELARMTLDGRLSAELIRIREIGWRWQGEALRLDGEVRRPWHADREAALRLRGDVALAPLAKAAGSDKPIDGKARIALVARWADQTLRLDDIQVHLGAARLRGRLEAAPHSGGGANITLDLLEVVLPASLSSLGPGTAAAQGRVHDGRIDLARAQLAWPGLAASLAGRIVAGPPLAVHATLTADLREISRAMRLGALSGRVSI